MLRVEGLDHVAMPVRDVSRSVAWYYGVLGPERRYRHFALRVDREMFDQPRHHPEARWLAPTFGDRIAAHSLYFTNPDGYRLEITTYDVAP